MPDRAYGARRLSADDVALESGTTGDYVAKLVALGGLRPGADGLFEAVDAPRVRTFRAIDEAGFGDDALRWVIDSGLVPVDRLGRLWRDAEPSGRTYAQFAASLGDRAAVLPGVYAALGLPEPAAAALTTRDEESVVGDLIELWAMVTESGDVVVRAARIAGEGVRRIQIGTYDLFDEVEGPPPLRLRRGLSWDEATEPSFLLTSLMPRLLVWLQARHAEYELFSRIVAYVEYSLSKAGRIASHRRHPAVAFVDLSDYTELTERAGDERAASDATTLHGLADSAARAHGGRVVKLLGDGVMLRYRSSADAVASVRSLMPAIADAGLPAAHAGIATGPVVVRDGDLYGHTVNLAARLAAYAGPGELVVTDEVAAQLPPTADRADDLGQVRLKGISQGVRVARLVKPDSGGVREA